MSTFDQDLFAKLLPASWEVPGLPDIEFPTTKFKTTIAHDLVMHKYLNRNGARVEDTGVAPHRHTFSVPLINTIATGGSESWGELYPRGLWALYNASFETAIGKLTHPELGELPCRMENFEIDWDAMRRGGVDCEISFVETLVTFDTTGTPPRNASDSKDIASVDLDSTYGDLRGLAPELPVFKESFADFARSLQAVGDSFYAANYRTKGVIDGLVYRANAVTDSLDRAGNALTWPAREAAERIKSAAHTIEREGSFLLGRTTKLYIVESDMTIPEICQVLQGASVSEIMRLNPRIFATPIVKKGTYVRYVPRSLTG